MNNLFRILPLCLVIFMVAGCNNGEKSSLSARLDEPMEIQGYKLGMNERAVLERSGATCQNPSEKSDADRICSASTSFSGQPALIFFYFFDNTLEKLALTILPRHGQLSEVSKVFSEELETKYGKPSTNNTSTVIWVRRGGAITINCGDERTMTVNLTSEKYEKEKAHREKNTTRGIEI